jgi:D-3-phosphoglycerate dehydrogenase
MKRILAGSRSFGTIAKTGIEILSRSGFELIRIPPEQRPLDGRKLGRILAAENPEVIVCGAEPIDRDVLRASERLRMVMKHGVGVDNIDIEAATELGILVASTPGANTEAVADLCVAMMLVVLRGICKAGNSTKAGGWDRFVGHELGGLTAGVVGTGRIGRKVIERLRGFGTRVLAYDVAADEPLAARLRFRYVPLTELLVESDIVTLHVPLLEQTRMMIADRELKLMKKTAYLVNVARGELIDEAALYRHLQAGTIAGAALDVFTAEPPQRSPLLRLDNVFATPHIAAYTYEAMERMDRSCAETIIAVMSGKAHENLLNPGVRLKP